MNSHLKISVDLLDKEKYLRLLFDYHDSQLSIFRSVQETIFLQDVNRIEDEEQRNKIRWQTKLGFDALSAAERENILNSRQVAWDEYSVCISI